MATGADANDGKSGSSSNDGKKLSPDLEKLKTEQPEIFQAIADHFVGVGKGEVQRQLETIKIEKQNLIKQLEASAAKLQDGDAEKDRLNKQIQELEGQVLSKEDIAKKALERTQKESQRALEAVQAEAKKAFEERETYKRRYENYLIDNTITVACANPETEAFYAPHVIANLKPLARVEQILDETGKETENFRVVLALRDPKENKIKDFDFSEGFKMFYEQKENINLFKNKLMSGSSNGAQRIMGTTNLSASQLGNMETYLQNREQILQKQ